MGIDHRYETDGVDETNMYRSPGLPRRTVFGARGKGTAF